MKKKKIKDVAHLKKIQLILLKELLKILNYNKIEYFLYYGSLLGAVRHKGFIPWDDDIDLGMTRENYEKFKNIKIEKNFLKILAPGIGHDCPYFFIKFYSTQYIFQEDMDCQFDGLGVNIDVFPIDYIPKNSCLKYFQDSLISLLVFIINLKVIPLSSVKGVIKFFALKIIKKILQPLKVGVLTSLVNKICNHPRKTDKMGCRASIYRKREYFSSEIFQANIKTNFENIKCLIPREFDILLNEIYGNYMLPPNLNKRLSNHTLIF
jgi:lipopolysaccharide cholinephosphotransferase